MSFPSSIPQGRHISELRPGNDPSVDKLAFQLEALRDNVLELAASHGALLFRGFDIPTPQSFAKVFSQLTLQVVKSLHLENMPYIGGAAVRTEIVEDFVFTANESPPSEPIPFHHEMAQVPNPPKYVLFYCEVPPEQGGETPLILSKEVYQFFSRTYPACCRKVEDLGVRYIR